MQRHRSVLAGMFRTLAICLGFQGDAAGQFFGLATPAHGKVFRLDASGVGLVFSRDIENDTAPIRSIVCGTTNAYELFGVDVSSDGSVLAMGAVAIAPREEAKRPNSI